VDGEVADDQFGYAIAGVGDVIGSSYADLLIGAPYLDVDGADAGRAYLLPGNNSSNPDAATLAVVIDSQDWIQPGTRAGDRFGFGVASAGDYDDDGVADYAVGAPAGNNITNATAGFCRVVDSGETAVPNVLSLWNAAWLGGTEVRLEFAFSLPVHEIEDVVLIRDDLNAAGRVVSRTQLWRGLPVALGPLVDPQHGGVVYVDGSSYQFLDLNPATGAAAMRYDLVATTTDGSEMVFTALSGPGPVPAYVPVKLELADAWPNPFNPTTNVEFRAPYGDPIRCLITDVRGRHVRDLYSGTGTDGWQTVVWNGLDDHGAALASGVYLIHLESPGAEVAGRVVLAK
jgi:hypothetical protein